MYTKVVVLEGLDRRFEERTQLFRKELEYLIEPNDAFGILMTAIPRKNDIRFDRVYHNGNITPELDEDWHQLYENRNDKKPRRLATALDNHTLQWRPKMRAARANSDSFFWNRNFAYTCQPPITNLYREIHCNGLVELGLVSSRLHTGQFEKYISPHVPLVLFANLITHVSRVRSQAKLPLTPFIVEVSVLVKGSTRIVGNPGLDYYPSGYFDPGLIVFPRYTLNSTNGFLETLSLFNLDLYHSLGRDLDTDQISIAIENWPPDGPIEHEGE